MVNKKSTYCWRPAPLLFCQRYKTKRREHVSVSGVFEFESIRSIAQESFLEGDVDTAPRHSEIVVPAIDNVPTEVA